MTKRILTAIKPTGEFIHIGNYFGAIAPMIHAQENPDYEVYMFLANLHSLTALHDPEKIHTYSLNAIKMYLACGLDPKKAIIYNQAELPAHAELAWILNCITNMGTAERMHAYKDAIAKWKAGDISVGVFTYPILMAADILLYDANEVPVGKDQKQHVEYARDIAEKCNRLFGETFVLPDPLIDENVATVPGIDGRKMSKSYNNYIGLFDEEAVIQKKIKLIPTWSEWIADPKDPDNCNVYKILKLFLTSDENVAIRKRYTDGGLGYKEVKDILFEKIWAFLQPIQSKFASISDDEVRSILAEGTKKARDISEKKIILIKQKLGFTI